MPEGMPYLVIPKKTYDNPPFSRKFGAESEALETFAGSGNCPIQIIRRVGD